MKITIEIDGANVSTVPSVQPAAGVSGSVTPAVPAAQTTAASVPTSPADLLAKAAQLGAQNAGPGPVLPGTQTGMGPVASVGAAWPQVSAASASAGSPPPHVFDLKGGCK
jgi:hypothetical protein